MLREVPIVYTHIPKTAGSTFSNALGEIYPVGYQVPTDDDDISELRRLLNTVEQLDLVSGHIRFPIAFTLFGDTIYLAAVRDPIARLCSHYFYIVREKALKPWVFADGLRIGFDRFYEYVIRAEHRLNLQCKFFSNVATAESAIETIRKHYCLVWNSDRLDSAWPVASAIVKSRGPLPIRITNWQIRSAGPITKHVYVSPIASAPEGSMNGDRPPDYRQFLGDTAVDQILSDNSEDKKLFDWINAQGGVYINSAKVSVLK